MSGQIEIPEGKGRATNQAGGEAWQDVIDQHTNALLITRAS